MAIQFGSPSNPNSRGSVVIPSIKEKIGKVYGVITGENTPTKYWFERLGGFNAVGTIFYKDYETSVDEIGDLSDRFFEECFIAKPLSQNIAYPLPDELVILTGEGVPSAATQENIYSIQTYYIGTLAVWNLSQHNAQPSGNEYNFKTFESDANIKNLLRFEGDYVVQGRKGNSIRFGSTISATNLNEWSTKGRNGDPLTIISINKMSENEKIHIEKINNEYSSIYLTSTQAIPLNPDRTGILNPLTNPKSVSGYENSQVILNGDRIVLNSKKDEVMLFATTNIELNTDYHINLNAKERVHLNSNNISLGTVNNKLPSEPILLGHTTVEFLKDILSDLISFASSTTAVITPSEGAPISKLNTAGRKLHNRLEKRLAEIEKLKSKISYTA
jgi:hypothetical protein